MQRMLIGLVLFLTVAVGALGMSLFNSRDQGSFSRSPSGASRSWTVDDPGSEARLEKLEGRLDRLAKEMDGLRRQQQKNATALARVAARSGGSRGGGSGARIEGNPESLPRPGRDLDRAAVSEADEAWYTAVKESVDRKRRISGQFANLMRRIDRLAEGGDIQPVPEHQRGAVEQAVERFVASNDDLLTRYLRKPSAELKELTATQRRDALNEEREQVVERARQALEPLLGAEDAATIVDRTLRSRRVFRGRRSLGDRGR